MEQNMKQKEMLTEKTWEEFRGTGLFWWINMILHTFGWVLVAEVENKEVLRVYPARTRFRGFSGECTDLGYELVTQYMQRNAQELYREVIEEKEENENK